MIAIAKNCGPLSCFCNGRKDFKKLSIIVPKNLQVSKKTFKILDVFDGILNAKSVWKNCQKYQAFSFENWRWMFKDRFTDMGG